MAPPAPKSDIDWATLQLTHHLPLNGHVEARYSQSTKQWTSPKFVGDPNISVSGICPGLNYGQQCYEGLKAFRTQSLSEGEQIAIFRPQFHAARMASSASALCLPPPPEELFLECLRMVVAGNGEYVPPTETNGFLYIRPVLFGSSAGLPLGPSEETIFAVYCHPTMPYHGVGGSIKGLVCEEFDRSAPMGVGRFKVGGNYAPVWKHAGKAMAMGFHITLHLDSATRNFVEEFATSAFLGHKLIGGRHILVVPSSSNTIPSATSDSIQTLAQSLGWEVQKVELPFSSLGDLDEVVAVGTAATAVPIQSLERLSTSEKYVFTASGEQGSIVGLARMTAGIQRGKVEDKNGWCWQVNGFPETNSALKTDAVAQVSVVDIAT